MSSPALLQTAALGTAAPSAPSRVGVVSRCALPSDVLRAAAPQVGGECRRAVGRDAQRSRSWASDPKRSSAAPRCVVQHRAVGGTATRSPHLHWPAATCSAGRCCAQRSAEQKTTATSCVGQHCGRVGCNRLQCTARYVLRCIACIAMQSLLDGFAERKWLRRTASVVQAQHVSEMQAQRCMALQAALGAL